MQADAVTVQVRCRCVQLQCSCMQSQCRCVQLQSRWMHSKGRSMQMHLYILDFCLRDWLHFPAPKWFLEIAFSALARQCLLGKYFVHRTSGQLHKWCYYLMLCSSRYIMPTAMSSPLVASTQVLQIIWMGEYSEVLVTYITKHIGFTYICKPSNISTQCA